ncbi:MAG: trypsin-like peptidase domain-containing protein, partial [Thermosynechococcaceae cyanobacterium]
MSTIRQFETVSSPQEAPTEVGVILKTDGNSGEAPAEYGISAQRLLVRGKGELNKPRIASDLRVIRGSMPESIIGSDDRTQVVDSETMPWRMICSLKINGTVGGGIGTGWFAGPKTIITAGHCVFHPNLGGWAKEIVIFPGRFESEIPFPKNPAYQKPIVSRRFSAVKGWTEDKDTNFDYAAIHIDDPVGNETGCFSIAVLDNDDLKGLLVNVAGYPGDRDFGRNQYFAADKIEKVQSNRFFYAADTYGGQSGGPAWFQDG